MQSRTKCVGLTRRQFVAGALGGAAVTIGCAALRQGWEFLNNAQSRTLAAICDQIVPADDFPSASEAGVLTYIDRQLARHFRRYRDSYQEGLAHADAMSIQRFGQPLPMLSARQQIEIVGAMELQDRTYFDLVRSHTLQG